MERIYRVVPKAKNHPSNDTTLTVASHADVLRGSSRVPTPRTSAELKDKFLSYCSQISAEDHMQIIGDPICAAPIRTSSVQCDT